jgi:hypothetical protein
MSPILTGESSRTIIDILKKGNLELLHSAIIGWMLDKNGEHGLHDTFLKAFVKRIGDKYPDLSSEHFESAKLETIGLKSRYDIKLMLGDKTVIIENKTKSLGGPNQLEHYQKATRYVVALGFSEISFSTVPPGIPLVQYSDVLEIMDALKPSGNPDFVMLYNQYQKFLDRELSLLDRICNCVEAEEFYDKYAEEVSKVLRDKSLRTENDLRYFNLVALESLRRYLKSKSRWQGPEWTTDKNQQSGAWLACNGGLPNAYTFRPAISELVPLENLWFHVELRDGLAAEANGSDAGCIQLRCGRGDLAPSLLNVVRQYVDPKEMVKKVKSDVGTFYVAQRMIRRQDLVLHRFEKELIDFMVAFGNFASR